MSGSIAAWAYKNLAAQVYDIDRVVLLGPSHGLYFENICATQCAEWETPLGNLKVD